MEAAIDNQSNPLSREEIKQARKLRNQRKKEVKREEKQANCVPVIPHQSSQASISIISRECFDEINNGNQKTDCKKKKQVIVTSLLELQSCNSQYPYPIGYVDSHESNVNLVANKLDKSQPVLCKGKNSDKTKAQPISHLKKQILASKSQNDNEDKYNYVDNVITDTLETLACSFIQQLVELQEKYYKRAPTKATVKRRYIVGFHQLKKYIIIKKIQLFVIAADIQVRYKDPLHSLIEELITLANNNGVTYVFVLKRRQIGRLTMKPVPVSCFGVLNYDGLNKAFDMMLENIKSCKENFVASE